MASQRPEQTDPQQEPQDPLSGDLISEPLVVSLTEEDLLVMAID